VAGVAGVAGVDGVDGVVVAVVVVVGDNSTRQPYRFSIIDKNTPTGDVLNFYAHRNLMFTERSIRRNINLCFGVYVLAFVGLCLLNAPNLARGWGWCNFTLLFFAVLVYCGRSMGIICL
jgi:hypothetical protein